MEKNVLIELMKNYKKNNSRLKLKIKERDKLQTQYDEMNSDINISSLLGINNDIRPKNKISDKVADKVINDENKKKELMEKINDLDVEIADLKDAVEQVDIRLDSLYENKKQLVIAYYIEGNTAEDIGDRLFLELYRRTCSVNGVYKKLNKCLNIMCEL